MLEAVLLQKHADHDSAQSAGMRCHTLGVGDSACYPKRMHIALPGTQRPHRQAATLCTLVPNGCTSSQCMYQAGHSNHGCVMCQILTYAIRAIRVQVDHCYPQPNTYFFWQLCLQHGEGRLGGDCPPKQGPCQPGLR